MKKLGLALGGGGARGLAHIVLQPPAGDVSILDFHKADKLVEIG